MPKYCYGLDRASHQQGANAKFAPTILYEIAPTIIARGPGAVMVERERERGVI